MRTGTITGRTSQCCGVLSGEMAGVLQGEKNLSREVAMEREAGTQESKDSLRDWGKGRPKWKACVRKGSGFHRWKRAQGAMSFERQRRHVLHRRRLFNLKRQVSSIIDTTDNVPDKQKQEASVLKGSRFIITLLGFFIPGRDANCVHCSWSCLPREWEEKNYSAALNNCFCSKRKPWFVLSQLISTFLLVQSAYFSPQQGYRRLFKDSSQSELVCL